MTRLLDVNVLVALLDSAHVHHEASVTWFQAKPSRAWATCPLTENGFVRVASGVHYPNIRMSPAQAADALRRFQRNYLRAHEFWPDDVSLADPALFDLTQLTGARQISDVYLAGLAFRRGGCVATLDAAIPWRAVRGATSGLVEMIATR